MTKKSTCTPQEFNLHSNCNILVAGSAKRVGLTKKADGLFLTCQSVPIWRNVNFSSFRLFSRLFVWVSAGLPALLWAYSLYPSLLTVKIVGV